MRNVGRVLTYGLLALVFTVGLLDYVPTYMLGGAAAMLVAAGCWLLFPQFKATSPQISNIVVRPRYWLYYMLIFLSGARRQIFMVFAVFMLVEKFGLHIEQMLGVLAVNAVVSAAVGPVAGWVIKRYGERAMLVFEYLGLGIIFVSYALVTSPEIDIVLYFLDQVLLTLAIGMNSYLKRIAAPEDLAGSCGDQFHHQPYCRCRAALALGAAVCGVWLRPCFCAGRLHRDGVPGQCTDDTAPPRTRKRNNGLGHRREQVDVCLGAELGQTVNSTQ